MSILQCFLAPLSCRFRRLTIVLIVGLLTSHINVKNGQSKPTSDSLSQAHAASSDGSQVEWIELFMAQSDLLFARALLLSTWGLSHVKRVNDPKEARVPEG